MLKFILAAALSASSSVLSAEQVQNSTSKQSEPLFEVGKATLADVIAMLGKPNSVIAMSDGTKMAVFVKSSAHIKGASFIPVVGIFASGAKSNMVIKSFTFGSDGLLKSFTTTDSNANCNASIAGASCH